MEKNIGWDKLYQSCENSIISSSVTSEISYSFTFNLKKCNERE
ncbi:8790_t:CDS:2 [Funneliformis geosporum]|uniref:8790_t:CDS:1 n=1 Tax=Funneliformis geosporum TaxID=1117311 RepID=A0A9W4X068_9GLOM|nr:8790_t:CDS:2 [Funneliformis geosporum]